MPRPRSAQHKRLLLIPRALKACDGLDGVVDGVIDNPLTCPFKVASLLCAQNQDPSTCLTQAQVTAVDYSTKDHAIRSPAN